MFGCDEQRGDLRLAHERLDERSRSSVRCESMRLSATVRSNPAGPRFFARWTDRHAAHAEPFVDLVRSELFGAVDGAHGRLDDAGCRRI